MTISGRSHLPKEERAARSRLAKLLHEKELLRGSLVSMARTCGKKGCRCRQGDKHVSLYLSILVKGKRRMIYVPAKLESWVRAQVDVYREAQGLLAAVSNACLERMLERKSEAKQPPTPKRADRACSEQE